MIISFTEGTYENISETDKSNQIKAVWITIISKLISYLVHWQSCNSNNQFYCTFYSKIKSLEIESGKSSGEEESFPFFSFMLQLFDNKPHKAHKRLNQRTDTENWMAVDPAGPLHVSRLDVKQHRPSHRRGRPIREPRVISASWNKSEWLIISDSFKKIYIYQHWDRGSPV